jgi:hypothetical protein
METTSTAATMETTSTAATVETATTAAAHLHSNRVRG